MLKKLQNILTYYDSEPTEVLQGLIWFIFAPIVLEATFFPNFWYLGLLSLIIGFGTLYSVVYSSLERRKQFGFAYGLLSILFVIVFFSNNGLDYNPMNWGWVVISISALSNIRRIQKKIEAKKEAREKTDLDKMYRTELLNTIKEKQKENFDLRLENISLSEQIEKLK
jgi:uncharacterized membrane protein